MAVSLKHSFQSAVADGGDTSLVRPSNWNAEHDLTMATGKLLGRTTAGTGAAEEISAGTGLSLSAGSLTNAGVTSFSAGTTGLTPSTGTTGGVTLAGTLAVANGGTGQTTYTDGQLLIGNSSGGTLTKATLSAGSGISITNGNGSITIAATGVTKGQSIAFAMIFGL